MLSAKNQPIPSKPSAGSAARSIDDFFPGAPESSSTPIENIITIYQYALASAPTGPSGQLYNKTPGLATPGGTYRQTYFCVLCAFCGHLARYCLPKSSISSPSITS